MPIVPCELAGQNDREVHLVNFPVVPIRLEHTVPYLGEVSLSGPGIATSCPPTNIAQHFQIAQPDIRQVDITI